MTGLSCCRQEKKISDRLGEKVPKIKEAKKGRSSEWVAWFSKVSDW